MPVTVRYWAGARAAAGVEQEQLDVVDLADLRAALLRDHPPLEPVLQVASLLVNGRAATDDSPLPAGATVEVLPPFAGG